jgi:putative ABC transport system ATP-binding protein
MTVPADNAPTTTPPIDPAAAGGASDVSASNGPPAPTPTEPPSTAAIHLESVTKTYGEGALAVHALRDVSIDIPQGQFVVVLGPSGSGKTTLMNLIGGIEPATAGRVIVGGRDLAGLDDRALTTYRREHVGFVFQFFNLIPTLTAEENVALIGELVGIGDDGVRTTLDAVGLDDRANHFPSALSGGEQQRVAIARAVVKRPTILLADEPTGSLDLDTGRQVLAVLRHLNRTDDRTVLLVTHNSAIAGMADRVLRLHSGSIDEDTVQPNPIEPEAVTW